MVPKLRAGTSAGLVEKRGLFLVKPWINTVYGHKLPNIPYWLVTVFSSAEWLINVFTSPMKFWFKSSYIKGQKYGIFQTEYLKVWNIGRDRGAIGYCPSYCKVYITTKSARCPCKVKSSTNFYSDHILCLLSKLSRELVKHIPHVWGASVGKC